MARGLDAVKYVECSALTEYELKIPLLEKRWLTERSQGGPILSGSIPLQLRRIKFIADTDPASGMRCPGQWRDSTTVHPGSNQRQLAQLFLDI